MVHYPEIDKLNQIYVDHQVVIIADHTRLLGGKKYYPMVEFQLAGKQFEIFIDDEFDDLRKNYPLLNLCLVLRELEGYAWADDLLIWCQERFLDPADPQVLDAYRELGKTYQAIESIIGTIDPFVTDWDFEMNAGAAQALRRSD